MEFRRMVLIDLSCGGCGHPQSHVTVEVPYAVERAVSDGGTVVSFRTTTATVFMTCAGCGRTVVHRDLVLHDVEEDPRGPAEGG